MASLMEKLASNSTIKSTAPIMDSKVFGAKEMAQTSVPMVNVALSGRVDGGITPGLLMLAGPSKHFKSAFALLMEAAHQKKHKDGVILFYDSEFGTPPEYFKSFGIDMDRVIHTPITDVEQLKFDITKQLNDLDKKDNVCIVIDSIGNLASKKEVDDAMDGKSVADMSRAKQMKSLFRIVTPHLNLKDIPLICVNHTYKEIGLYPKDIVSGGTGAVYSADTIFIVGRQQDKDGTELTGYNFILNVEKSRFVREKSKIPINVTFEGGVNSASGLFDLAREMGYIKGAAWYETVDPHTGEVFTETKYRRKDVEFDQDFWFDLLNKTEFGYDIHKKYALVPDEKEKEAKFYWPEYANV